MNAKRSLYLIAGMLCVFLIPIASSVANTQPGVQIQSVSMQLKETRPPVGAKEIHVYDITVVLYNNDAVVSDNITVVFHDPEFNTSLSPMRLSPPNATISPKGQKMFSLTDWPTTLSGKILINISFNPSSPSTVVTTKNTGYYHYTLTIPTAKKTTSTPGFEILIFLGALAVLLLLRKMKK